MNSVEMREKSVDELKEYFTGPVTVSSLIFVCKNLQVSLVSLIYWASTSRYRSCKDYS